MISSSENRVIYKGNGETTEFSYSFKIFNSTDIKLLLVKLDGTRTILTSDYYVDMNASKVYYPGYAPGASEPGADTPPKLQDGETLVVYREVPINQLDKMPEQWPFDVNEQMHDKSCVIDQQLADGLDRSIKFGVEYNNNEFDPTLPIQAGYGWRVSDDGKSIVPIKDSEIVLQQTEQVYADAIRDTNAIKDSAIYETERIKGETEEVKVQTQAISDLTADYMDNTQQYLAQAEAARDNAIENAGLAERWAQAIDSPDYIAGNKSSKTWAELAQANAEESAAFADQCRAYAAEAGLYDPNKTYQPGQVAMTSDGAMYRCVAESKGDNPATSPKWVMVTIVISDTFEFDVNGDLQPLYNPKSSDQFEIDSYGDIMPGL